MLDLSRTLRHAAWLLLPLLAGCRSSEESRWKGLSLDPVTSAPQPVESAPVDEPATAGAVEVEAQPAAAEVAAVEGAEAPAGESSRSAATARPASEEQALSLEKKRRELFLAELRLEIAEQRARGKEASLRGRIEDAGVALDAATEAQEEYERVEAPRLLGAADLRIAELEFALEKEQRELEQMEREYAGFEEGSPAAETGEIVIWRSTQDVKHATRRRALEVSRKKTLQEFTIPRRKRELQLEVTRAQRAVDLLRAEELQLELEVQLELREAKDALSLLRLELERMDAGTGAS